MTALVNLTSTKNLTKLIHLNIYHLAGKYGEYHQLLFYCYMIVIIIIIIIASLFCLSVQANWDTVEMLRSSIVWPFLPEAYPGNLQWEIRGRNPGKFSRPHPLYSRKCGATPFLDNCHFWTNLEDRALQK